LINFDLSVRRRFKVRDQKKLRDDLKEKIQLLVFDILFLVLLGFLVGVVASMTGVGGGTFIVPALSIIYQFTSQEAAGTSLAVIVFTSLASTYAYSRQKRIDYRVGAVSAIATAPGAVLGAYLTTFVSSSTLGIIFSFFMIFLASSMLVEWHISLPKIVKNPRLWHRNFADSGGKVFKYDVNILSAFVLAFFGGLSSGLLGIGGGALIVPILHLVGGIPMHLAVATSMFIMVFTSLAGVATHLQLNNVRLEYSAYIVVGVVFGAQLGTIIAKRVSGNLLKRIFSIILIIVSVRLLLNFV
jgi:uncharacterized membrane protein YfcA